MFIAIDIKTNNFILSIDEQDIYNRIDGEINGVYVIYKNNTN